MITMKNAVKKLSAPPMLGMMKAHSDAAVQYRKALASMPKTGDGFNPNLIRVAAYAKRAGITERQFISDIMKHARAGTRTPSFFEIQRAYRRALTDAKKAVAVAKASKPAANAAAKKFLVNTKNLSKLFDPQGRDCIDELKDSSPVKFNEQDAPGVLLEALYEPDEKAFIGEKFPDRCSDEDEKLAWQYQRIKTPHDWIEHFRNADITKYHYFCVNPLTGEIGRTQEGKPSYRADSCIAAYRYCLLEYDSVPGMKIAPGPNGIIDRKQLFDFQNAQAAFWLNVIKSGAPVVAVIATGGKSLHAIYHVGCLDRAEWDAKVCGGIYSRLSAAGFDKACKNPSRLSRFPGACRPEQRYALAGQKLLYLKERSRL
ncbi:MAG TPA: hypothetical protein DCZ94_20060 [Lentisphaeria bacterium]|nr:MAG: hypothetical protein A2X48_14705 [Lentisphaerae bacterium GWF2_49_21]HBC89241.1 hypothetical protein [Lentisphaeria bacterium]